MYGPHTFPFVLWSFLVHHENDFQTGTEDLYDFEKIQDRRNGNCVLVKSLFLRYNLNIIFKTEM